MELRERICRTSAAEPPAPIARKATNNTNHSLMRRTVRCDAITCDRAKEMEIETGGIVSKWRSSREDQAETLIFFLFFCSLLVCLAWAASFQLERAQLLSKPGSGSTPHCGDLHSAIASLSQGAPVRERLKS